MPNPNCEQCGGTGFIAPDETCRTCGLWEQRYRTAYDDPPEVIALREGLRQAEAKAALHEESEFLLLRVIGAAAPVIDRARALHRTLPSPDSHFTHALQEYDALREQLQKGVDDANAKNP
jgi:hypothetical protein